MGPNDTIPAQASMEVGDWACPSRTRAQLEALYKGLERRLFVHEVLSLIDHPQKAGEISSFVAVEDAERFYANQGL